MQQASPRLVHPTPSILCSTLNSLVVQRNKLTYQPIKLIVAQPAQHSTRPLFTTQKIEWAIHSFEPYKSPGPDGLHLICLQLELPQITRPSTPL